MATLQRFKWIPMLLEAIQEAKQRTDWPHRTAGSQELSPEQKAGAAGSPAEPPARRAGTARREPQGTGLRQAEHQSQGRLSANA
ncbi:MAG: hypothetical protein K6T30_04845, partial [Alicyclobacillus sp.]|nr:hypothetical protein [Alicyclobacillus sp.]